MADLVAIGYPDENTAAVAATEAQKLAAELIIEPEAIAAIRRDQDGKFHVSTTHHPVAAGPVGGCSGGCCSECCFLCRSSAWPWVPVSGALIGKVTKTGIDKEFQAQVRDMLQPGTLALFLVVERATPDKAAEALSIFGGTI